MTALQIVGTCFAGLILSALLYLLIRPARLEPDRENLLRVICSVFVGLMGLFFGTDIVAKVTGNYGPATWVISAAGGAALFLIVFMLWRIPNEVPPPSTSISLPEGMSFRTAVATIASEKGLKARFDGLTEDELDTPLSGGSVTAGDDVGAIKGLHSQLKSKFPFEVKEDGPFVTITKK